MTSLAVALACGDAAWGDTVTLRNGRSIDGTVTGRHEGYVVLRIGNIGTMRIPEDEIERIEKNTRTGYLDPDKGKKPEARSLPKITPLPKDGEKESESKEAEKFEPTPVEELDPELLKEIEELVSDLTQQRTQKRTRAERKLEKIGEPAVPKLIEISAHPFDRTRAAVFRLLRSSKDFRIVEPCLAGMKDEDRFVRKLAWEALQAISGESHSFPWDGSEARRNRALQRWESWAAEEKKRRAEAAKQAKEAAGAESGEKSGR